MPRPTVRIPFDRREAQRIADIRDAAHEDDGRHFNPDFELVGVAGELAFEQWSGIPIGPGLNGAGDEEDFKVAGIQIDVKTFQKANNLIVEAARIKPGTAYVLAQYEPQGFIEFRGWEWGKVMQTMDVKTFGKHTIPNHFQHWHAIRPMHQLRDGLLLLWDRLELVAPAGGIHDGETRRQPRSGRRPFQ